MTTLSNCPANLVASPGSTLERMKKEALAKERQTTNENCDGVGSGGEGFHLS